MFFELLLFLHAAPASLASPGELQESFFAHPRPFCLSSAGGLPASSIFECTRLCALRPVCCGASFFEGSASCALMEGVPPNQRPPNAVPGACTIFIRQRCRPCPDDFSVRTAAAPRRRFKLVAGQFQPRDVPGQCNGDGIRVAEAFPAPVFHELVSLFKRSISPRELQTNTGGCRQESPSTPIYCDMLFTPVILANMSMTWPSQRATVGVDYYEQAGVDFQSSTCAECDYLVAFLRFHRDSFEYGGAGAKMAEGENRKSAVACECLFID